MCETPTVLEVIHNGKSLKLITTVFLYGKDHAVKMEEKLCRKWKQRNGPEAWLVDFFFDGTEPVI